MPAHHSQGGQLAATGGQIDRDFQTNRVSALTLTRLDCLILYIQIGIFEPEK